MLNKFQSFLSLRKEKQKSIIKFFNYIASQINIDKVNLKTIKKSEFEYLLSKSSYKYLADFKSLYKTRFSVRNILKSLGVVLREKKEIIINKELEKEIKEYRKFVTNKHNLKLKKQHLQRENTFDSITRRSLLKFVEYLNNEKGIELDTLAACLKYFPDYCDWLLTKYKTETFQIRTRFLSSFISFCIATKRITKKDKKMILKVKKTYSKLKQRINYVDGRNSKLMSEREKINISVIIAGIKKLEQLYITSKDFKVLKAKIILKLLLHLAWRGQNIRILKLGETLYYENGLWHYRFTPEQQKAPLRKGKKLKNIEGVFPTTLQEDLTDYIDTAQIRSNDYLFTTQQGNPYDSPTTFSKYVSTITKKYCDVNLNPHSFRKIVFTYLVRSGFDTVRAELILWHKPKGLTETDFHYFDVDINDAVLEANKVLMKLYEKPKKQKKDEKIIRVDFNRKKAQE